MPEIDSYADVLDGPQRRVWTKVAAMSAGVSGVLMGGTAVAMHLRHRRSDDLDIMTLSEFSGAAVARRLRRAFRNVEVIEAAENCCAAIVDSVRIEFFRALPSGEVGPAQMRRVAEGPDICGMPIGSLPDLLATKLDVIRFRPKLRDYIDLAAIDKLTGHKLEDGLSYYCMRFGYAHFPDTLDNAVALLARPGNLPDDPHFEQVRPGVLDHLRTRAFELSKHLATQRDHLASPAPPASERDTRSR